MNAKFSILINSLAGGGAERQVYYLWKNFRPGIYFLEDDVKYPIDKKDCTKIGPFGRIRQTYLFAYVFFFRPKQEIALSFLEFSNFINICSSRLLSRHKAFVSVRISPDYYKGLRFGWVYLFLMKCLYPHAQEIICNSEECANQIYALTGKRPIFIPNAVDLEGMKKYVRAYDPNKENKKIVIVGRLVPQKNIVELVHVFSELHKSFNKLELHIVGEGPEKLAIAELIKHLRLDSNIFLRGFLDNPFELIASCDLSVLSSNSEGFPNVVLEAMALGLPVVAADCPTGPAEIIKSNEFGILLPVLNSSTRQTWVESITSLLNQPELLTQLHKKSLLRASDFSEASVMSQWKKTLGI